MDIVARLKSYMDHVGLPISQFADIAQIPRPTMSQILSGRNKKISNELITKLHVAFPQLNISWLLFGDGPIEIDSPYSQPAASKQPVAESLFDLPIAEPLTTHPQAAESPAPEATAAPDAHTPPISPSPIAINPDSTKKIQTIMVFYNDNSFEIFTPSQR